MSNPATLLAVLLERWEAAKGQPPETQRGGEHGPQAIEFWREQGRAVGLLNEIETALRQLEINGEDIEHYLQALPAWYRAVFSFNTPWQNTSQSDRKAVDKGNLALLKALGTTLNGSDYVIGVEPDNFATLADALDNAEQLVRDESVLSTGMRNYLQALIREAHDALDSADEFGDGPARTATFRLTGAMQFASKIDLANADQNTVNKWSQAVNRLLFPFLTGTAGQLAASTLGYALGITGHQ